MSIIFKLRFIIIHSFYDEYADSFTAVKYKYHAEFEICHWCSNQTFTISGRIWVNEENSYTTWIHKPIRNPAENIRIWLTICDLIYNCQLIAIISAANTILELHRHQ
jgi:hypothetical protein